MLLLKQTENDFKKIYHLRSSIQQIGFDRTGWFWSLLLKFSIMLMKKWHFKIIGLNYFLLNKRLQNHDRYLIRLSTSVSTWVFRFNCQIRMLQFASIAGSSFGFDWLFAVGCFRIRDIGKMLSHDQPFSFFFLVRRRSWPPPYPWSAWLPGCQKILGRVQNRFLVLNWKSKEAI